MALFSKGGPYFPITTGHIWATIPNCSTISKHLKGQLGKWYSWCQNQVHWSQGTQIRGSRRLFLEFSYGVHRPYRERSTLFAKISVRLHIPGKGTYPASTNFLVLWHLSGWPKPVKEGNICLPRNIAVCNNTPIFQPQRWRISSCRRWKSKAVDPAGNLWNPQNHHWRELNNLSRRHRLDGLHTPSWELFAFQWR